MKILLSIEVQKLDGETYKGFFSHSLTHPFSRSLSVSPTHPHALAHTLSCFRRSHISDPFSLHSFISPFPSLFLSRTHTFEVSHTWILPKLSHVANYFFRLLGLGQKYESMQDRLHAGSDTHGMHLYDLNDDIAYRLSLAGEVYVCPCPCSPLYVFTLLLLLPSQATIEKSALCVHACRVRAWLGPVRSCVNVRIGEMADGFKERSEGEWVSER